MEKFINNKTHTSTHKYSLEDYGLTKEFIYDELKDVFAFYGFDKEYWEDLKDKKH